jgi:DHA3 family macrolide efflux protein-like MFS transporter
MTPVQFRRIAWFLFGQTVSLLGSSVVMYGIIWYIARETGSGWLYTLAMIAALIPQGIMSMLGGVWADRYSKKLLIIAADAGIAVITAALAWVFISGEVSLVWLILALVPRAFGGGIQQPTVSAMIPDMVPQSSLMRVNAVNMTLQSALFLISPVLAAFALEAWSLGQILLIDVVTAVLAIVILAVLKVPRPERAAPAAAPHVWHEMGEGLRFALGHPAVRRILLVFMVLSLLLMPASQLAPIMVVQVFGGEPGQLAAVEVAFSIGLIAGGVILSAWGGLRNRMTMIVVVAVAWGVVTMLLGWAPWFWLYVALWAVCGLGAPGLQTVSVTALQEQTPPEVLGRVMGLQGLAITFAMPLGMLMAGPLTDVFSSRWVFIGCGVLGTLAAALLAIKAPPIMAPPKRKPGEAAAPETPGASGQTEGAEGTRQGVEAAAPEAPGA